MLWRPHVHRSAAGLAGRYRFSQSPSPPPSLPPSCSGVDPPCGATWTAPSDPGAPTRPPCAAVTVLDPHRGPGTQLCTFLEQVNPASCWSSPSTPTPLQSASHPRARTLAHSQTHTHTHSQVVAVPGHTSSPRPLPSSARARTRGPGHRYALLLPLHNRLSSRMIQTPSHAFIIYEEPAYGIPGASRGASSPSRDHRSFWPPPQFPTPPPDP